MSRADEALIFLHLPKTAGSTFNAILTRQFAADEVHFIASDDMDARQRDFRNLPEERRRQVRLLRGHQRFGLHEYLPHGGRYITVLRDPLARVASHFAYVKKTRHPLFFPHIEAHQWTLADYVANEPTGEMRNGQTRWIAGVADARDLDEADLEQALRNLETHFAWVGLTEHFDLCLVELAWQQRWLRVYYQSRNVGGESASPVIDVADRAAILAHNQLDLRLYQHVAQRLGERALWVRVLRATGVACLRSVNAWRRSGLSPQ